MYRHIYIYVSVCVSVFAKVYTVCVSLISAYCVQKFILVFVPLYAPVIMPIGLQGGSASRQNIKCAPDKKPTKKSFADTSTIKIAKAQRRDRALPHSGWKDILLKFRYFTNSR